MGNVQYNNQDKRQKQNFSVSYGTHYVFQSEQSHDKIVVKKYHLSSEQEVKSFKILLEKYQQAMTHANLLPILSVRKTQNCFEIAYKYITNTIENVLNQSNINSNQTCSEKQILTLISQIVQTLDVLQRNGLPLSIIQPSKIFIQKNRYFLGIPLLLCDQKPQHIQPTIFQLQYYSPQKVQTIYDKKDYYSIQKGNIYTVGMIVLKLMHKLKLNNSLSSHVKFPSSTTSYQNQTYAQQTSKQVIFQELKEMQIFIQKCLFYLKPFYSQRFLELIQSMLLKNPKNRFMYQNVKLQIQNILINWCSKEQNKIINSGSFDKLNIRIRGYNEVSSSFLTSQIFKHFEAIQFLNSLSSQNINFNQKQRIDPQQEDFLLKTLSKKESYSEQHKKEKKLKITTEYSHNVNMIQVSKSKNIEVSQKYEQQNQCRIIEKNKQTENQLSSRNSKHVPKRKINFLCSAKMQNE